MNAEEDNMREKQRRAIQQSTMMLHYFDEGVPVLYLSSTLYVPVIAFCEMLGLRMFCGIETVCSSQQGRPRPLCTCCKEGLYDVLTIEITRSITMEISMR
jgi:hypothetical protein